MRSSIPLYDALADGYDEHFAVAHRRAYDDLAWEATVALLSPPQRGRPLVDAGCGVGRWSQRFVALGHDVIGIEQSPRMAEAARARCLGPAFEVIEASMDEVHLEPASAAGVVAMGSLQYTQDPAAVLKAFARWVVPGGFVAVLVDGLSALVTELTRAGRTDEAEARRLTRCGVWEVEGQAADLHLFGAAALGEAMTAAGLDPVEVRGVLCGWTVLGREQLLAELDRDREAAMARERAWSLDPALADLGKQLLGIGVVPGA